MISHDTSDLHDDSATIWIFAKWFGHVTVSSVLVAVVITQLIGLVERLVDRRV